MVAHRTTIELSDEALSWLRSEAARRGMKGYSSIIDEAIRRTAAERRREPDRASLAAKLRGSISKNDATRLENAVAEARSCWRSE